MGFPLLQQRGKQRRALAAGRIDAERQRAQGVIRQMTGVHHLLLAQARGKGHAGTDNKLLAVEAQHYAAFQHHQHIERAAVQGGGFIGLQNANVGAGQVQAAGEAHLLHIALNHDTPLFAQRAAGSQRRKAVIDAVALAKADKIFNGKVSFLHNRQPFALDQTQAPRRAKRPTPYHPHPAASMLLRTILIKQVRGRCGHHGQELLTLSAYNVK